uniref:Uncharacterized protein n=1 Tax=Ascaris lumbricoides TaxID=6252 RepID=A0A9J2PJR8_ASCLU
MKRPTGAIIEHYECSVLFRVGSSIPKLQPLLVLLISLKFGRSVPEDPFRVNAVVHVSVSYLQQRELPSWHLEHSMWAEKVLFHQTSCGTIKLGRNCKADPKISTFAEDFRASYTEIFGDGLRESP